MTNSKFIAYYRVSTVRQGQSGLGLEAQRMAVCGYLNGGDWQLISEYTEVESGKRNERPQLLGAVAHARATGATLVIAKLDRLSRDAHFLLGLEQAGVEFIACDMPHANRLTVGIMALVAEEERRGISARTKAALAAAKARGQKLGNPNGARALRGFGNAAGVAAVKTRADQHAAQVLPVIEAIRNAGTGSLKGIARELNERGILAARGGVWDASRVRTLLARGNFLT